MNAGLAQNHAAERMSDKHGRAILHPEHEARQRDIVGERSQRGLHGGGSQTSRLEAGNDV
jgi:hypothetical protein